MAKGDLIEDWPAMSYAPHLLPKVRSKDIMDAPKLIRKATGVQVNCCLRIASIAGKRCADPSTVVMSHNRAYGKGTSTKTSDLTVSFACMTCHSMIEGTDPAGDAAIEAYPHVFWDRVMRSVFETQAILVAHGFITVPDGRLV